MPTSAVAKLIYLESGSLLTFFQMSFFASHLSREEARGGRPKTLCFYFLC